MRRGIYLLIMALVVAACGDGESDSTEPSQFPTGSVRSWFDALDVDDTARALELTYETSMLVIVATENELAPDQLGSLLRRGATEETAADYLSSFAAALRDRYRRSLADVTVDGFTEIGENYAAVEVTGEGGATIIARRAPGGLWQVDLVGTLGPPLITQVRMVLENSGEGEDAETISEVFASDVMPALDAAAAADPENLALASEIRVIRSLLGP